MGPGGAQPPATTMSTDLSAIGKALAVAHGLRIARGEPPPGDRPRSVGEIIDRWVLDRPDAPALIDRVETLSFGQADELANRTASRLVDLGVGPGDRVAVSLPNLNDIVVLFLAAQRMGAIWVGINRVLAGPEKRYVLADAGASVFLGDPEMVAQVESVRADLPDLRHIVTVDPADAGSSWRREVATFAARRPDVRVDPFGPAAIAYTSGTTGFPKGVVHSQHNMVVAGSDTRPTVGLVHHRTGVVLPLSILNLMILGPVLSWQSGGTSIPIDRVDTAGLVARVHRDQVEAFSAAPVMVHDLLFEPGIDPNHLSSLVALGVGGAGAPAALHERYIARFGHDFAMGYGLTEAPTAVTRTDPDSPGPPGNTGRELPQVRVRIFDEHDNELPVGTEGEVVVGAAVEGEWAGVYTPMLGYWGRPDATDSALRGGWLHTGDIGYLTDDASLVVIDRRNDLIIRGGSNVYPAEVERVIANDPTVAEVSVVGKPDERLGEVVVAFVLPAPGTSVDTEALAARCRAELAHYKVPVEWHVVDAMPRNAMGKVIKAKLRDRLGL